MRIVAGAAKGRRLAGPADGTRPTSDRAREGMFNSLSVLLDLDGARVLDLFAGTGAVGLEALSRGASCAVFVESGRRARAVLERNIADVSLPGAVVVARPVAAALADAPDEPFHLVFADPPYAFEDIELTAMLAALETRGWLAPQAILVVERAARGRPPTWPDCVTSVQDRRYGEGVLWYGRRR